MSTGTFVNALIGLAREYKTVERRAIVFNKRTAKNGRPARIGPPHFGHDVTLQLLEDGYFTKAEATVFGDALQGLLEASDPRRNRK